MGFKPPKTGAYKQFVILDSDGVISSLSALDGGQIDEILKRSADEQAGGGSAEVKVGVGKGGGKRSKSKKVEEEVRLARTRHSAAAKLIDQLHEQDAIGVVEGPLDAEVAEEITAGMVLQFRAELRLHPLHQADQMIRSFIQMAPMMGEKQSAEELKQVMGIWSAMVGTDRADSRVLLQPHTVEDQDPTLLLPVPKDHFEVNVEDVLGEVTVVAQVERVLQSTDEYPVVRMLRGAPTSPIEREAVEEALPELIEGLSGMGVDIAQKDIFVAGPGLILRAICVYR